MKQLAVTLNEVELDAFRAEAALMMSLRPHTNIVPLLGVCIDVHEVRHEGKLAKLPVIKVLYCAAAL